MAVYLYKKKDSIYTGISLLNQLDWLVGNKFKLVKVLKFFTMEGYVHKCPSFEYMVWVYEVAIFFQKATVCLSSIHQQCQIDG